MAFFETRGWPFIWNPCENFVPEWNPRSLSETGVNFLGVTHSVWHFLMVSCKRTQSHKIEPEWTRLGTKVLVVRVQSCLRPLKANCITVFYRLQLNARQFLSLPLPLQTLPSSFKFTWGNFPSSTFPYDFPCVFVKTIQAYTVGRSSGAGEMGSFVGMQRYLTDFVLSKAIRYKDYAVSFTVEGDRFTSSSVNGCYMIAIVVGFLTLHAYKGRVKLLFSVSYFRVTCTFPIRFSKISVFLSNQVLK